jgi:hypothetical protein
VQRLRSANLDDASDVFTPRSILFHAAARDGDTVTVSTLPSTAGAQSLINYQDEHGAT